MKTLAVDKLTFTFDHHWQVSRYDEWTFYRQKFQSMCGGEVKGVDILAIDGESTAWLIEVKDYRQHLRIKVVDLAGEVALKAFDTLAALLPARVASDDAEEVAFASAMHTAKRLRIVLHVEQPKMHSILFPRAIKIQDVQLKLRSLVKPVDAHPVVCESGDLRRVSWKVISGAASMS